MMLGATAVRLVRSSRGAAAALSTTSSSSLSHVFHSQCSLSKNNDTSAAAPSRSMATRPSPILIANGGTTSSSSSSFHSHDQHRMQKNRLRWFSSKSSKDDQPATPTAADDANNNTEATTISGSSQHDTWVQFQRSIAVSGFDTGQTVKERQLGKKNRGGKIDRKRKEREAEAEAALKGLTDTTQLKGGEFPELRYSDEETERLLAEAYAAIPPRAGKRGTLHLKREKRRWWIKRQYDAKKKHERMEEHTRRGAHKKRINQEVKDTRAGAADVREKDLEYQSMVLQRWAEMNGHHGGELQKKLEE